MPAADERWQLKTPVLTIVEGAVQQHHRRAAAIRGVPDSRTLVLDVSLRGMMYWETAPPAGDGSKVELDYAKIWQSVEKVVYSKTLQAVTSAKTRIERALDAGTVRRMKEESARDISVGGPTLAGQAMAAGLVDEMHLFLVPMVVGGGTRALPDELRVKLALMSERRFGSGVVYVQYRFGELD